LVSVAPLTRAARWPREVVANKRSAAAGTIAHDAPVCATCGTRAESADNYCAECGSALRTRSGRRHAPGCHAIRPRCLLAQESGPHPGATLGRQRRARLPRLAESRSRGPQRAEGHQDRGPGDGQQRRHPEGRQHQTRLGVRSDPHGRAHPTRCLAYCAMHPRAPAESVLSGSCPCWSELRCRRRLAR
jgi:hypothetical protein